MKRFGKMFGVTVVAVFAMAAMSVASASASTFTASATGELTGEATSDQEFTTGGGGSVVCTEAATSGNIESTEASSQVVLVEYDGCQAFGFVSATISPAEYELHADGTVDILNTITITVPLGFCTVTVGPQEVESVSYTSEGGAIEQHSAVGGIDSTHSGGLCSSGENGTYTGSNLVERVGGGTIAWHE